jgi:hypothetical protein
MKTQSGFCSLTGDCSSYNFITDYSFMASFVGDSNYLTILLVFFARTTTYPIQVFNTTQCAIYVEMLDESLADSIQIVFAQSMHFHSSKLKATLLVLLVETLSSFIVNAPFVACTNCAFSFESH